MPNIFTVNFPTSVEMTEHIEYQTGRTYISFQSEGSYGWIYVGSEQENTNLDWTWTPAVVTPPDPLPTVGLYKVIHPVNVRAQAKSVSTDIGDLFLNQTVEILLAGQIPENVGTHKYLWGKLTAIVNPTEAQLRMLRDYDNRWVALKDGNTIWLEAIPSV